MGRFFCGAEEEEGSSLKAPNHLVEPCCNAALVVGGFIIIFCVAKLTSDLTDLKCFPRPSACQRHSAAGRTAASLCCGRFFFSLSLSSRVSVTLHAHAALLSCNTANKKKKQLCHRIRSPQIVDWVVSVKSVFFFLHLTRQELRRSEAESFCKHEGSHMLLWSKVK